MNTQELIEKKYTANLDDPLEKKIEFYINLVNNLPIEKREIFRNLVKNKSCLNCTNGTCRVESYEKSANDVCVGWDNKRLIGQQIIEEQKKLIKHNNRS